MASLSESVRPESVRPEPAISLVVSTIGRPDMLTRLVRSLVVEAATADFELIVVDQSEAQSAQAVVSEHASGFRYQVLTSDRGVSRGRNVGLGAATAPLVTFPDDDCWFPGTTLASVVDYLSGDSNLAGATTMLWDHEGLPNLLRWSTTNRAVTLRNYYRTSIGSTMFVRTELARHVNGFDEGVGPGSGSTVGSCEDSDFLMRIVALGQVDYRSDLGVHHDAMVATIEASVDEKMFSYGVGQAWFWRRHRASRHQMAYLLARKATKVVAKSLVGQSESVSTDRAFLRGAVSGLIHPVA